MSRPPEARGAASERPVTDHPAALALAGLLSLVVAIGIGRFVYTPILPYMTAGLGLAKSQAGLLASANYLGYLLGALAVARRAPPGDQRRWLLGALAVSGLSTGAMALTTGMAPFLLLRFANGIAGALTMVLGSSLVMDRLALAGRAGWASLMYVGVGGGVTISALAVPAIAAGGGDWKSPWLFCGAIAVTLSLVVAVLFRKPQAARGAPPTDGNRPPAPGLGRFVLAYGLFGFGYVTTATFVSDMVRADPLLQPAEQWVWLYVGLTAAPSAPLWNWAGRRWGNGRAFVTACLIEAVGVALSVSGAGIWPVLAAASLLGGTFVGLTAIGLVHVRHLSGGDPRRNLALMTAAFGLGQMIGPTLTGVLYDTLGSYQVPSLLAVAALILAAALAARQTEPQDTPRWHTSEPSP
ncbi:MAG: YbfB/YjiJ family MFS transporter [Candidatus Tectomicrobia bacterium]|nr:YbfB/YjiJ family MFS transporter [Candidatus Tectomicrobia bacterium]